jgi:electron transfer flavoprotein alpha subunit
VANFLVYMELVDQAPTWGSLLALRQGRALASELGATLYAVLPCAEPPIYGDNDIIAVLSRQGADKVILMTHGNLAGAPRFAAHGEALLTAAAQFPPTLFLLPDGSAALDLAPRMAARLGAVYAFHPEFRVETGETLILDQPTFDGTARWQLSSTDLEHPVVAVVAPDPRALDEARGGEEAEVVVISPGLGGTASPTSPAGETAAPTATQSPGGPGDCQILVGAGAATGETWEAIQGLADTLHARIWLTPSAAAVQPSATAGKLADLSCPGQRPFVLVALGVSGAPETLQTIPGSAYLVAVNPDATAPIFGRAQVGLRRAALETLQQLRASLAPAPEPPAPEPPAPEAPVAAPLVQPTGSDAAPARPEPEETTPAAPALAGDPTATPPQGEPS